MAADRDTLDFLVIGAQKAGTTTLFEHLRRHPEIALPGAKEVPYFSHDDLYERGWQSYMQILLANEGFADPARRAGTITPQYMIGGVFQASEEGFARGDYDERTVPDRIRAQLPGVRLIAILRDPVERAISHHRMSVMGGRDRRSFDDAVAQLLDPDELAESRRLPREENSYVSRGEYGRILGAYREVFPDEQLLVVFTEELERAPAALLARIYDFIDVRRDFEPENLGAHYKAGLIDRGFSWRSPSSWMAPSSPFSPQGVQRGLKRSAAIRAAWRTLPPERRRRLHAPYSRLAHGAARRNRRNAPNAVAANAPASAETLARLREHYGEDSACLRELIGEGLPWLLDPPGTPAAGAPASAGERAAQDR